MLQFFGTDGVRGIAGKKLDEILIKKIANAIVAYLKFKKLPLKILMAKDTRASCDWIFCVLCSVLLSKEVEVHDIDVAPTACVAYLTKLHNFSLGITISASHNTYEYNGIKFFDKDGYKMDDCEEELFETFMQDGTLVKQKPKRTKKAMPAQAEKNLIFKNINKSGKLKDDYVNHLHKIIEQEYAKPIVFDCANGASCEVVKQIFPNKFFICSAPDGMNINKHCGCTNIDFLVLNCKLKKCVGFAFDGDADRLFCVDETGRVLDGDRILFILAKEYLNFGDNVVATIASNYGLEQSLKSLGMKMVRTNVGDKYIAQLIRNNTSVLGGESSGHTIISHYSTTGDGIVTAICLLNILAKYDCTLEQLMQNYIEYKQFSTYFECTDAQKKTIIDDVSFMYFIELCEQELGADGRILVRASGTEPKIRIMVEGTDFEIVKILAKKIEQYCQTHF